MKPYFEKRNENSLLNPRALRVEVCRTCIVKYLETSKYCPICDVQVHKTKPLLNIRSDQLLQDIVYKLVPGLFHREIKQRKEFHAKHPEENLKNLLPSSTYDISKIDWAHRVILMPDEYVSLSIAYSESDDIPANKDKGTDDSAEPSKENQEGIKQRFLKCPAELTILQLKKFIRCKYGLARDNKVDIMCAKECLEDTYTLMDVAYIYFWKQKDTMKLLYRIYEKPSKRRKVSHDKTGCENEEAGNVATVADINRVNGKTKEESEGLVGDVKAADEPNGMDVDHKAGDLPKKANHTEMLDVDKLTNDGSKKSLESLHQVMNGGVVKIKKAVGEAKYHMDDVKKVGMKEKATKATAAQKA